jgi:hypothetical protein
MDYDNDKIESMLRRYRPLGPPAALKEQIFRSREKRLYRIWPAIAASILLVAGIVLVWRQLVRPTESVNIQAKLAEIEISVVQAGRAEQLLAVANMLASQPGGEYHAKGIYYEVVNHYPNFKSRALEQLKYKFPSERREE